VSYTFRRSDFRPSPAVESVLLQIERRHQPLVSAVQRSRYEDFVVAMFTAWKPTVRQAAKAAFPRDVVAVLDHSLGRDLDQRPSEIGLATWIVAFQTLVDLDDPRVWRAIAGAAAKLEREQAGLAKRSRTDIPVRHNR
ncbi:MAG: rRNA adenine N-6-methyltransferase family protein, partial [Thermomicrobiales bacterium]